LSFSTTINVHRQNVPAPATSVSKSEVTRRTKKEIVHVFARSIKSCTLCQGNWKATPVGRCPHSPQDDERIGPPLRIFIFQRLDFAIDVSSVLNGRDMVSLWRFTAEIWTPRTDLKTFSIPKVQKKCSDGRTGRKAPLGVLAALKKGRHRQKAVLRRPWKPRPKAPPLAFEAMGPRHRVGKIGARP